MTKAELFLAAKAKLDTIASDLSLPLVFIGIDAQTLQPYDGQAYDSYLSTNIIWGEETRPYLNGADGQNCNSIIQIDCIYPKLQEYNALQTAQSVKDKIPLDSNIAGTVYNVTISPVMRDATTVQYSVSVTVKQIDV